MPEKETLRRARADKRAGKSPSTQAGEFVREEIHHVREGKHGARSSKQAIAIGLAKARRAGVKLAPPGRGAKSTTKKSAESASRPPLGRKPKRRRQKSRTHARALRHETSPSRFNLAAEERQLARN